MATGSSPYTVSARRSPRSRRTHLPPFRSMAGMMSMTRRNRAGFPRLSTRPRDAARRSTDARAEVAQDRQADALALLRMELAGKEVVAGDGGDELAAVVGERGDQR